MPRQANGRWQSRFGDRWAEQEEREERQNEQFQMDARQYDRQLHFESPLSSPRRVWICFYTQNHADVKSELELKFNETFTVPKPPVVAPRIASRINATGGSLRRLFVSGGSALRLERGSAAPMVTV